MRSHSWNAEGLVAQAWKKLPVAKRDELARLTGIPATNLSTMNTGRRPMTLAVAEKITAATGVSLLELGAPLNAVDPDESLIDRLLALEDRAETSREAVIEALVAIHDRLDRIEAALQLQGARQRR